MELSEYKDRFKTLEVDRDDAGVLTVRMHSRGESLLWGGLPHRELPELFSAVASDRENRVMVLTGTGDRFITLPPGGPGPLANGGVSARGWDRIIWEGNRLVDLYLAIDIPVICAVNGPAIVHSEIAVLADIVLASDTTYFQDAPHFPMGLVPGDSMQVVWPMLLGPNRGRYFLLTGQKLPAQEALSLGVVGEVLSSDELMPRALQLASDLAALNPILLRNTRHALVRPWRRAMAHDLHTGLALEAIASMASGD
jgi:enoyl-CoA hydratase/carnithine racemase